MKPIVPNPSAAAPSPSGGNLGNGEPSWEFDPADIPIPDLDALITEDGAPVDNLFVEKQYRLLTEPLNSSWTPPGEEKQFLVASDVGIFAKNALPPLVPDCFLSMGVTAGTGLHAKENRSYFLWLVGKPPDVVIEIVSDRRGGAEDIKRDAYARMGVLVYVIFDPLNRLRGGVLRAGILHGRKYKAIKPPWFPEVGLGLTLWQGAYEGATETWLRWCEQDGRLIPTGAERADEANQQALKANQKALKANQKALKANQKAERLAAQLRALGVDPDV